MNKFLNSATIVIIGIGGLGLTSESALATSSSWSGFSSWFKSKPVVSKPYWVNGSQILPTAIVNSTYAHQINLTALIRDDSTDSAGQLVFILSDKHPNWIELSKDGRYLQGNQHKVMSTTAHIATITISAKNLKTKQISNPQTFEIPIENIEFNLSEEASMSLDKLINLKSSKNIATPQPEIQKLQETPIIQPLPKVVKNSPAAIASKPVIKEIKIKETESIADSAQHAPKHIIEEKLPESAAINNSEIKEIKIKETPIQDQSVQANNPHWSKLNEWGKKFQPQWQNDNNEFPTAIEGIAYPHQINLNELVHDKSPGKHKLMFALDKRHPEWLQISADGMHLQGNQQKVNTPANSVEFGLTVTNLNTQQSSTRKIFKIAVDQQAAQPRWSIDSFADVAIAQKNYEEINLNDYVSDHIPNDSFLFSLTPGKTNPEWLNLQANGLLTLLTDKISQEDINTTQIIYLTAISTSSGKSSSVEVTIKITANDKLPAPQWKPKFHLTDAIISKPYFVDLAGAVKIDNLAENDQLTFQIIDPSFNWLQIGSNGFSLVGNDIPESAANNSFEVNLRVTSKMSGKSRDFKGHIFVNEAPRPFQWQPLPIAAINKSYSLDLNQYVNSNIRNDHFKFEIDLTKLPSWLSLHNNQLLTGTPQDAKLIGSVQEIEVTTHSQVSGLTSKTALDISINADQQLAPQWKKDFLQNFIIDDNYRSDDLAMALENVYSQDDLKFEYLAGPNWLGFNSLCHCLVSQGKVPANAAGKAFTIKLRVHSKASGKTIDYQQLMVAYRGVPHWTKTTLPTVKIAQSERLEIPLADYTQDDISGDQFDYTIDALHSPRWISLAKKDNQTYLMIDPKTITANEVDTAQTVRLMATSQITHKTSAQLLVINVSANHNLPAPSWKHSQGLPVATVGVGHATDLNEFLHSPIPNDRLTIKLAEESPTWLKIKDNRLMGLPPRSAIGGPYQVTLSVHSKASNQEAIIKTQMNVQLVVVANDNMETHQFYDNHQSIVIRGLKKNHKYRLFEARGSHFDYGPFYSPHAIKTAQDWDGNPFYSVGSDKVVESGDDGVLSIVYYTLPNTPAPEFELMILR